MQILIGESTSGRVVELVRQRGWGRMWVYRNILALPGERWGFDNGVFKIWDKKGPMNSSAFDELGYLARLSRARDTGTPYLAVVPDLPAAGLSSLHFSLRWRERLARVEDRWPWYLAVQDGMTPHDVAPHIAGFRGVFLGGSTVYKATLPQWVDFAHRHGVRCHYARCTSPMRLHWARSLGCDSIDSSQPLWSWQKLRAFEHASLQEQLW